LLGVRSGDLSKVLCWLLPSLFRDIGFGGSGCISKLDFGIWDFVMGRRNRPRRTASLRKIRRARLIEIWELRAQRIEYTAGDRLKYSDTVLNGTRYINPLFPARSTFPASFSGQSHRSNYRNITAPHITPHYINALTGPLPCNFPANISLKKSFKNISFGSNTFLKSKYSLNAF